ncbi:MAG: signal peptidase II [Acidimicrobiia bacterium]
MSSGAGSRRPPRGLAPVIVGSIVLADQLTKSWMVAHYATRPLSIVGEDVELHVARNSGGAFSTFTNATVVLALLAIGLTIWLVRTLRRTTDRATIVALALVLGGALGNLCDRIFRSPGVLEGHVVDFVKVGSFPSFNVADSAITIGAILLIIISFRHPATTT